jgi:MarR family transcriptional regulator, transcriptional regulator for hemolysin
MKWKLAERPGYLVNRVARLATRYAEMNLRGTGLGVAGFPVFEMLRGGASLMQKDLVCLTKSDQSGMARLLNRMEGDGMIVRAPDPGDKRSRLISLTQKAESLLPQVDETVSAFNELAVRGMSDLEVQTLQRLLKQMIQNLEGEMDRSMDG